MTLPAVVRVELTPETRRLLLRLIEAVEKLGRSQSPTVFAEAKQIPDEMWANLATNSLSDEAEMRLGQANL